MASHESRAGRAPSGGQEEGCPQLCPGCAGWYQAEGCCVPAYAVGWVLLGRGALAGGARQRPDGGCPRFADQSGLAMGAIAAPTRQQGRPPSWLVAGGRSV